MANKLTLRKILGGNAFLSAALAVAAVAVRLALFPAKSGDYVNDLLPWYNTFREQGFAAISGSFYNYAPPYMYWLALIAKLGIPALEGIKAFSCFFDVAAAFSIMLIVRSIRPEKKYGYIAFFAVLFLPHVILNGSMWGQCDSVYASFLMVSIYFLLNNRKYLGLIAFGVAFSFKMQALFLLPFLFVLYMDERIKLYDFLIVPAVYFIMMLPAIIAGRPIVELLTVYITQAGHFYSMQMNFPNFYQWFGTRYETYFVLAGLCFAAAVVFPVCIMAYRRKMVSQKGFLIDFLYFSLLLMPFVLPKMHDRYSYPADLLAVPYLIQNPKRFYIPLLMLFVTISPYFHVFYDAAAIDLKVLAVVYGAVLVWMAVDIWKKYAKKDIKQSEGAAV